MNKIKEKQALKKRPSYFYILNEFSTMKHSTLKFLSLHFIISNMLFSSILTTHKNFHEAMVCSRKHKIPYKQAYKNSAEDTRLFDFAESQYEKYIIQQQGFAEKERIPKIIHQIWIGPHDPPPHFLEWQRTWRAYHPDWEYILWTDKEAENLHLINKRFYDEETNYGAKSDILRLEILYQFGGVYLDIDCECLKPFDELHHLCDFYTGFFQVNFLKRSARVANGVIGSKVKHPLIGHLIDEIQYHRTHFTSKTKDILIRTGPSFFTNIIKKYIYDATQEINVILPANYFYSWSGQRKNLKLSVQPETMLIHYYTGTWHDKSQKSESEPT